MHTATGMRTEQCVLRIAPFPLLQCFSGRLQYSWMILGNAMQLTQFSLHGLCSVWPQRRKRKELTYTLTLIFQYSWISSITCFGNQNPSLNAYQKLISSQHRDLSMAKLCIQHANPREKAGTAFSCRSSVHVLLPSQLPGIREYNPVIQMLRCMNSCSCIFLQSKGMAAQNYSENHSH